MTRDVVVVGGGPTGLMLACELRLAGVSVTVLERLAEPTGLSNIIDLTGRTIETLDHRGLLDRFDEGISLDPRRLNGSQPKRLSIEQVHLEELLEERAYELGATLRWGHELLELQADQDGMTLDIRDPNGDYQLRTRFLVGCDGEQYLVCKLARNAFSGVESTALLRHYADRVFMAGDAAHPPESAPDFSLGLQDAVKLGRKLAAMVHGWASPSLLDTYRAKPYPAGERGLMHTPAQALLLRPDGYVAWAADMLDRDVLYRLRLALATWFGESCRG